MSGDFLRAIEFSIGNHGERSLVLGDRRKRVLEACAGEGGEMGIGLRGRRCRNSRQAPLDRRSCCSHFASASIRRRAQRPEIVDRIDGDRGLVQQRGVDAHAVFEGPKLLQSFAGLQRRHGKRDEAPESLGGERRRARDDDKSALHRKECALSRNSCARSRCGETSVPTILGASGDVSSSRAATSRACRCGWRVVEQRERRRQRATR